MCNASDQDGSAPASSTPSAGYSASHGSLSQATESAARPPAPSASYLALGGRAARPAAQASDGDSDSVDQRPVEFASRGGPAGEPAGARSLAASSPSVSRPLTAMEGSQSALEDSDAAELAGDPSRRPQGWSTATSMARLPEAEGRAGPGDAAGPGASLEHAASSAPAGPLSEGDVASSGANGLATAPDAAHPLSLAGSSDLFPRDSGSLPVPPSELGATGLLASPPQFLGDLGSSPRPAGSESDLVLPPLDSPPPSVPDSPPASMLYQADEERGRLGTGGAAAAGGGAGAAGAAAAGAGAAGGADAAGPGGLSSPAGGGGAAAQSEYQSATSRARSGTPGSPDSDSSAESERGFASVLDRLREMMGAGEEDEDEGGDEGGGFGPGRAARRAFALEPRPLALSSLTLEGFAEKLSCARPRSVVVMCGAGISVSAGIPDFRSPGTGLYHRLQEYDLPHPQAIFELDFFRENPRPFFTLVRELFPGTFAPTRTHLFIRLLHDLGLLRRCFTQNIDSLEAAAGLPPEVVVAAHGNFDAAHCIDCGAEHSVEYVKRAVFHPEDAEDEEGDEDEEGREDEEGDEDEEGREDEEGERGPEEGEGGLGAGPDGLREGDARGLSGGEDDDESEFASTSENARGSDAGVGGGGAGGDSGEEREGAGSKGGLAGAAGGVSAAASPGTASGVPSGAPPTSDAKAAGVAGEPAPSDRVAPGGSDLGPRPAAPHLPTPSPSAPALPRAADDELDAASEGAHVGKGGLGAEELQEGEEGATAAEGVGAQEASSPSAGSSPSSAPPSSAPPSSASPSADAHALADTTTPIPRPPRAGICRCWRCGGLVKPDIVMFGENLPERFWDLSEVDMPEADLLVVMGTSLVVMPFAGLIDKVGLDVPRLLLNREVAGETDPVLRALGYQKGFDFSSPAAYRDVYVPGDCDDSVQRLAELCGWSDELRTLEETVGSKERIADMRQAEDVVREMVEKIAVEREGEDGEGGGRGDGA